VTIAQRDFPSGEREYRRFRLGVKTGEEADPGEMEKDSVRACELFIRDFLVGPSAMAFDGRPVDCGLCQLGEREGNLKCLSNFLRIFLKPWTLVWVNSALAC
jgi:hypothetical protein